MKEEDKDNEKVVDVDIDALIELLESILNELMILNKKLLYYEE